MHRKQRERTLALQHVNAPVHLVAIRGIVFVDALLPLLLVVVGVDVPVARDDFAVGEFHHQGGIIESPVGVNQQPRESRKQADAVETFGKRSGHLSGTDVVGDVALKGFGRQAQLVVMFGDEVGGVVTDNQQVGFGLAIVNRERRCIHRLE